MESVVLLCKDDYYASASSAAILDGDNAILQLEKRYVEPLDGLKLTKSSRREYILGSFLKLSN